MYYSAALCCQAFLHPGYVALKGWVFKTPLLEVPLSTWPLAPMSLPPLSGVVVKLMVPFWFGSPYETGYRYRCRYRYRFIIWVAVKIMVPVWCLNMIRFLGFTGPQKGTIILTTAHLVFFIGAVITASSFSFACIPYHNIPDQIEDTTIPRPPDHCQIDSRS